MDCSPHDCITGLAPVIPPWAQLAAYIAVLIVTFTTHATAQRQPGAPLQTYLGTAFPQLLPPNKPRRRRTVITSTIVIATCVLLYLAAIISWP